MRQFGRGKRETGMVEVISAIISHSGSSEAPRQLHTARQLQRPLHGDSPGEKTAGDERDGRHWLGRQRLAMRFPCTSPIVQSLSSTRRGLPEPESLAPTLSHRPLHQHMAAPLGHDADMSRSAIAHPPPLSRSAARSSAARWNRVIFGIRACRD